MIPAWLKTMEEIFPRKTGRDIIRAVAQKHGVTVEDMRSDRKNTKICLARFEACYRMRTETKLSYPMMGRLLGDRDHTTTLNAARRYAELNGLTIPEGYKARPRIGQEAFAG